jgi:hypothetical protein
MSGFSTPCSSMFMLPMRSMVLSKSKPWNMWWWKCFAQPGVVQEVRVALAQVLARRDQEAAVPQAGSQITSVGCGAVISTISWMMWRGVRNWPFCPALAILPSMYS